MKDRMIVQNSDNKVGTIFGECDNAPNATKLMRAMRHLDYDNVSAVADLVDNAIDAGASGIWVDLVTGPKGETARIEVIDDGRGMDYETLDEAMKLGSDTSKNPTYDLGLYGMGLITASISFGKRLEVISKARQGIVLKAIQDLTEIEASNRFFKTMEEVSDSETLALARDLAQKMGPSAQKIQSFTRVAISEIDHCQWARSDKFAEHLKKRLGQTFRKFIQAGKCRIFVNGTDVPPIDPIFDFSPSILIEDVVKLEAGDIRIVVTEATDYGAEINKEKGLNISNQGFYLLRNNREIAGGQTLGIFSKHNDYNLLRIEFSFPGTLDSALNTGFTKQGIKLDQSIADKVERICNPFIRQVRTKAKQKQIDRREQKEDFTEAEKYITQKSHLLKNPKSEIEKRNGKENQSSKPKQEPDIEKKARLNIKKRQHIDIDSLKVNFRTKELGEKGALYESDQEKDVVVVYWNKQHPFYQRVVAPAAESPDIFNPLAYLIYCYASAELIAKDGSDSQEVLDNIRWDVGRNLAILLK